MSTTVAVNPLAASLNSDATSCTQITAAAAVERDHQLGKLRRCIGHQARLKVRHKREALGVVMQWRHCRSDGEEHSEWMDGLMVNADTEFAIITTRAGIDAVGQSYLVGLSASKIDRPLYEGEPIPGLYPGREYLFPLADYAVLIAGKENEEE